MNSFAISMQVYKQQLQQGDIQRAYRGLMQYLLDLRTHIQKTYPRYEVARGIYFGYMDMTYFSIFPPALKERKLKIALVFLHEEFRFEVWLSAANKGVQAQYLQLIQDQGWDRYRVVPTVQGYDSIVEHVIAADPDFSDFNALTGQIERETLGFIAEVEAFLAGHEI